MSGYQKNGMISSDTKISAD